MARAGVHLEAPHHLGKDDLNSTDRLLNVLRLFTPERPRRTVEQAALNWAYP